MGLNFLSLLCSIIALKRIFRLVLFILECKLLELSCEGRPSGDFLMGFQIGAFINYVEKQGIGGQTNVNNTTYYHVVKLSIKGEGIENPQNPVNVVYGCPLGSVNRKLKVTILPLLSIKGDKTVTNRIASCHLLHIFKIVGRYST